MTFRLIRSDFKILKSVAEHRILTVTQVGEIFKKSKQVIRRRLRDLERAGLIEVTSRELGRGRGRPENSLGLTEQGVVVLKDKGFMSQDVPYDKICSDLLFCSDHQLLLNWFRIQLYKVEKVISTLSIETLAYNSPFLPKKQNGHILITDYSPVPGTGMKGIKFTPDAVFCIRDSISNKSCLFFLEVDCGTETIASPKRDTTDIRQKIINYQWYFQSQAYKRYEEKFNCLFHGFRLLFLTNSQGRLKALCELTQEIRPSNFIFLTECNSMFEYGLSAKIWIKGGNSNDALISIIGNLNC